MFHAGVGAAGEALVTAGGRVLTLVADGVTFAAAIARVYDAVRAGGAAPISRESAMDVAVARDHLIRLAGIS